MELFDVAIGLGIGLIIGLSIFYITLKSSKQNIEKAETLAPTTLPLSAQEKLIQMPELEKARKELNAILLEKELLSSALTRVYEAEVQKKITKAEREQLSQKYREQLKAVEEKLGNTELLIEVGELENLRDELINLFERKIVQIESRLNQAKAKIREVFGPAIKPSMPTKGVEKKEKNEKSEEAKVDEKVKALREEVLQALDRLEQIDIEE